MTIISMQDIRTQIASIANRAQKGEQFIVVRKSRPVFQIVPVADATRESGVHSASATPPQQKDWVAELFAIADRAHWRSDGKRIRREDLYDV